jgi:hypothetical protein
VGGGGGLRPNLRGHAEEASEEVENFRIYQPGRDSETRYKLASGAGSRERRRERGRRERSRNGSLEI